MALIEEIVLQSIRILPDGRVYHYTINRITRDTGEVVAENNRTEYLTNPGDDVDSMNLPEQVLNVCKAIHDDKVVSAWNAKVEAQKLVNAQYLQEKISANTDLKG